MQTKMSGAETTEERDAFIPFVGKRHVTDSLSVLVHTHSTGHIASK